MKPLLLALAVAVAAPADAPPDWLYPRPAGSREVPPAAEAVVTLPGSGVSLRGLDLRTAERAVDWFPDPADPLPAVIRQSSRPGDHACGFCHLPRGGGRVENASLAGLGVDYIIAQTEAFRSGARRPASPGWLPGEAMRTAIAHASGPEIAEAARWFSRQPFTGRVRVVESATLPAARLQGYTWVPAAGQPVPIAGRLIEMPDDVEAFEKRDPRVRYTAFVPPGSLARGETLAAEKGCIECHSGALAGWGPGRSPSYILRQLLAFRTGTRATAEAAAMQTVVADMSMDDMVAVAAWLAAQPVPE